VHPKEEEDDPYESSQITALIANPAGIFGIYSYRDDGALAVSAPAANQSKGR